MTKDNKPKKILNNNAIALLLFLNLLATIINIVENNHNNVMPVAYASTNENTPETDEKRKNSDNEGEEEYTNDIQIDFELESVAHFSEEIKGIPMYVAFKDDEGVYFTYAHTENPESWEGGYWYVSNEVLKQGYYDVDLLQHDDELRAIYINDNVNGGTDYMQLRPCNDTEKGYAYNE